MADSALALTLPSLPSHLEEAVLIAGAALAFID